MPTREPKAGGMPRRYTAEQVSAALVQAKGLNAYAARLLGCAERTVYYYVARYPSVKAARDQARQRVADLCELRLFTAIDRGESWAIMFYARTQMRDRGYGDRAAIDVTMREKRQKERPRSLSVNYDEYNKAYADALKVVRDAAADDRDSNQPDASQNVPAADDADE